MLLQIYIDISTLSYCVKLEVEFVDTSTFFTEFLDVASNLVKRPVKRAVEFVYTSTYSTAIYEF